MRGAVILLVMCVIGCKATEAQIRGYLGQISCDVGGQIHLGNEDYDSDGILNALDNCITKSNADQFDSNSDGYGNACDPDLDDDVDVDGDDVTFYGSMYLTTNTLSDFNNDGIVNSLDTSILRTYYFPPEVTGLAPGPSSESACGY